MSAHFQSSHFASSQFLSSHFGRGIVAPPPDFTPVPVHPPGMDLALRRRILEDDELILVAIMAFLQIKDD